MANPDDHLEGPDRENSPQEPQEPAPRPRRPFPWAQATRTALRWAQLAHDHPNHPAWPWNWPW